MPYRPGLVRIALGAVAVLAACDASIPSAPLAADADRRIPRSALGLETSAAADLVNIDFDNDTPGQPPSTGGPNQPTSFYSFFGTSVLVQASANGIATQPVVLTAQAEVQASGISATFAPVGDGVVRIEATTSFNRLVEGWFLETTVGSGPIPGILLTRLRMTASGEIRDQVTRTVVGTYSPNQPFRIRVDVDMSTDSWAVSIDNELNGFGDDPVVSGLPFLNPGLSAPTVGGVGATLLVVSAAPGPTSVAYDDIRVFIPTTVLAVDADLKPGSFPNTVNPRSNGVLPVAILSTDGFEAATVEPTSVRLGPAGTEAAAVRWVLEDVDDDGDVDLLLHFRTESTGIQCGDVAVMVTGTTVSGASISGSDSIRTVGCK